MTLLLDIGLVFARKSFERSVQLCVLLEHCPIAFLLASTSTVQSQYRAQRTSLSSTLYKLLSQSSLGIKNGLVWLLENVIVEHTRSHTSGDYVLVTTVKFSYIPTSGEDTAWFPPADEWLCTILSFGLVSKPQWTTATCMYFGKVLFPCATAFSCI